MAFSRANATHGWEVNDDKITIKWLDSKPAPEEVL